MRRVPWLPASDARQRPWIATRLLERGCADFASVVDVGPGDGSAADFYRPLMRRARWTGVEIWEPYDAMFGLRDRYDPLIVADVRDLDPLPEADLYLFGDVLEHMPAEDAVAVWDRARLVARWLVIGIPVQVYEQGAYLGNPHEAHVHHWTAETVLARFAGIEAWNDRIDDSATAAFIARGAGMEGT